MNKDMTIAMTVWGNRISPVFDSSNSLLIVKICQGTVLKRTIEPFDPNLEKQLASIFSRFRVETLICGAITDGQSEIVINQGIRLIPFIAGDVGEILESFIQWPNQVRNFLMPGAQPDTHLNLN